MEIHEVFDQVLQKLQESIDTRITNGTYMRLNQSARNDSEYLSEVFCNSRGDFLHESLTCYCDSAMFGYHCQNRGIDYWGNGWTAVQTIFGLSFGILSIVLWFGLTIKIKANIKLKAKMIQLFMTPKYLILINLVWISTARFFFIIIDPFCQRNILNHTVDIMVYDMIYSSYAAFYLLLLIVWNGLQTVFDIGMKKINKRCYNFLYHDVKVIFIIMLVLTYPIQFVTSYFQSSRSVGELVKAMMLFFFFFLFMILYCGTIAFICELKKKLNDIYEGKQMNDDMVHKYVNFVEQNQTEEQEMNQSLSFLDQIIQQNLLGTVENYIFNKQAYTSNGEILYRDDFDINDQSDYEMDYEKEIMNLDCFSNNPGDSENGLLSNLNTAITCPKIEQCHNTKETNETKSPVDKNKKYELTKNDVQAMNKLFALSYSFLVLTILILSFACTISFQKSNHSPTSTIITICISFTAELIGIGIIYSMFFRNSKLQEYQNLKIIGEINKYMNYEHDSKPLIVFFDFTNKPTFKRFKNYVKEYK